MVGLKKVLFILFMFIFVFSSTSAKAFYGGEKFDNSPYVVHFVPNKEFIQTLLRSDGNDLRPQAYKSPWCSGAIIHPHVVITDAHCLYDKEISPEGLITTGWSVSYPGVQVGSSLDKASLIVATFFMSMDFYKINDCPNPPIARIKTCSPIGDIAAVVVRDPLPVPSNLKIATLDEINNARNYNAEVIGFGYGLTEKTPNSKFEEMKVNKDPMVNFSRAVKNIRVGGDVPKKYGDVWPDFIFSVEHKVNQSSCSGDSGGPFYIKENGFMYYIGTNAGSNWDICTDKNPRPSGWTSVTWIATLAHHYEIYTNALNFVNTKLENSNIEIENVAKIENVNKNRSIYNKKPCKQNMSTKVILGNKFTCIKKNKKLTWMKR